MRQLLLAALLVTKCFQIEAQELFAGFKMLGIPRTNVALGAEWIPGTGPNGNGVGEENIAKSKSYSETQIANSIKARLDLSILSYLKVNPNYMRDVIVKYDNIEVYTVKDLKETNITSGQYIIYEYLKVKSIKLDYGNDLGANIEANLTELFKDLKFTALANSKKRVSFSGEDLVFAYRIFQLGTSSVKESEKPISENSNGSKIVDIKLAPYDVRLNYTGLDNCVNSNLNAASTCLNSEPIEIIFQNNQNVGFNGAFNKKLNLFSGSEQSFSFSKIDNGKLIVDNISVYVMAAAPLMNSMTRNISIGNGSKVKLSRITTDMKAVNNPSAPGW